jgi:cation transport ATPase
LAERTVLPGLALPQGLASLLALLAFGDEPKPGAREALAAAFARGMRAVMISGRQPRCGRWPWRAAWA